MKTTNRRENSSFLKIFTLLMVMTILLCYHPTVINSPAPTLSVVALRNLEIFHRDVEIVPPPTAPVVKAAAVVPTVTPQIDCLARAIYYEAGSESFAGKLAVAQVVMNRLKTGQFGHSICQVVYEKTQYQGSTVCQFSWVCNPSVPSIPRSSWDNSIWVAKLAYFDKMQLANLVGALYYHADYSNPGWHLQKVAQIGHHIFYKPY